MRAWGRIEMRSINAAFFVLILTLTVCSSGFAQQFDSCEASTAVKQAIREWIIEYTYSTKPYGQRMQPIRELLKRTIRCSLISMAVYCGIEIWRNLWRS